MIGVLLLSHGTLCEGAVDAASVIMGRPINMAAVPLHATSSTVDYAERVERAIDSLDEGDGVLVLVDIMGGTPFNTVARLYQSKHIAVVSGLNLSMLLSVMDVQDSCTDLALLAQTCIENGTQGIRDIESLIS